MSILTNKLQAQYKVNHNVLLLVFYERNVCVISILSENGFWAFLAILVQFFTVFVFRNWFRWHREHKHLKVK